MTTLKDLAATFKIEQPPSLDLYTRAEFLSYWMSAAEEVIAALPQPNVVGETAFEDADQIESALKDLLAQVGAPATNAIEITASGARNFLILAFIAAAWGTRVHAPDMVLTVVAQGIMTEDELIADYKRRLGVFQAISKIGHTDFLEPLYKQKGAVSGIGLAPVVIGGVEIGGWLILTLATLAAITFAVIVVSLTALFLTNRLIDKYAGKLCLDAQGKPYPATQESCVKWLNDLRSDANDLAKGPQQMINTVLTYGAIGLGIYALIVIGPDLIRSVRALRSA